MLLPLTNIIPSRSYLGAKRSTTWQVFAYANTYARTNVFRQTICRVMKTARVRLSPHRKQRSNFHGMPNTDVRVRQLILDVQCAEQWLEPRLYCSFTSCKKTRCLLHIRWHNYVRTRLKMFHRSMCTLHVYASIEACVRVHIHVYASNMSTDG